MYITVHNDWLSDSFLFYYDSHSLQLTLIRLKTDSLRLHSPSVQLLLLQCNWAVWKSITINTSWKSTCPQLSADQATYTSKTKSYRHISDFVFSKFKHVISYFQSQCFLEQNCLIHFKCLITLQSTFMSFKQHIHGCALDVVLLLIKQGFNIHFTDNVICIQIISMHDIRSNVQ